MSKAEHETKYIHRNSVLLAFYEVTGRNINILHRCISRLVRAIEAGCSLVSSLFTIYRWSDVVPGHS